MRRFGGSLDNRVLMFTNEYKHPLVRGASRDHPEESYGLKMEVPIGQTGRSGLFLMVCN